MRWLWILSAALLASLAMAADPAKPVPVPGTNIEMIPPASFVKANLFAGFMNQEIGGSIMVTMLPFPYQKMTPAFTAEQLAKKGMTLTDSQPATFGACTGMLVSVLQQANDQEFAKWIACFGNDKQTALVTATVPRLLSQDVAKDLIDALLSARITVKTVRTFEGLKFLVVEVPPLKIANRMNNMLGFTRNGQFPNPSPSDPIYLIGSSLSAQRITNLAVFAKARLAKTVNVKEITITKTTQVAVDGLHGIEITATTRELEQNTPLVLYQVILPDKDCYYLIQGMASQREARMYLPIFRKITNSFTRKLQPKPVKNKSGEAFYYKGSK